MANIEAELRSLRRHPEGEQDRIAATVIVAIAEQALMRGGLPNDRTRDDVRRIRALAETIKRGH